LGGWCETGLLKIEVFWTFGTLWDEFPNVFCVPKPNFSFFDFWSDAIMSSAISCLKGPTHESKFFSLPYPFGGHWFNWKGGRSWIFFTQSSRTSLHG
jgi:hypothetical protein